MPAYCAVRHHFFEGASAMMYHLTVGAALFVASAADSAQDARSLTQDILTKGAALFDMRDAAAMAATYMEDADGIVVIKDNDTGTYKTQVTRGRSAIERGYQNIFKDRKPGTTSRNVV